MITTDPPRRAHSLPPLSPRHYSIMVTNPLSSLPLNSANRHLGQVVPRGAPLSPNWRLCNRDLAHSDTLVHTFDCISNLLTYPLPLHYAGVRLLQRIGGRTQRGIGLDIRSRQRTDSIKPPSVVPLLHSSSAVLPLPISHHHYFSHFRWRERAFCRRCRRRRRVASGRLSERAL